VHRSAPDWQQGIVESSSTKSFNEVIGDPFLEADKTYAHSTTPSPLAAAPLTTSHAQNNSDTKPAPQADAATTPAATPHKRTAPKSTHPAKAAESRQTDDDDGGVIVIDHHKK
jgi:hypothetical protein